MCPDPDSPGLTEEQCDEVWENRDANEFMGLDLPSSYPTLDDEYKRQEWDREDDVPCGCVLWLRNDGETYTLRYNRPIIDSTEGKPDYFNCAANEADRARLICKNWAW